MTTTVLVVEDDVALAAALGDILTLDGYAVVHAADGEAALGVLARNDEVGVVLSDVHMAGMDGHALLRRVRAGYPELPVVLMTAYATIEKAVAAMQGGAADYLVKPFEADVLLRTVGRFAAPGACGGEDEPVAEDEASRQVLQLARRVAATAATVMITGESGTGKEVVARYIHRHSDRVAAPFVAINCAAIPENMLEATLFGYEKGAFTGAHKATPGKFEQAQGGTLLLDEISEMDLALQAKLLRVLQEHEVERLGGGRPLRLDVRVLATSNRDMRAEVAAGRFREDLYYRLNVFPLPLRPLRERPADILPLARRLLADSARKMARTTPPRLSRSAEQRLLAHSWPGNVRELDNLLQRALILQDGSELRAEDLLLDAAEVAAPAAAPMPVVTVEIPPERALSDGLKGHEYQLIVDALRDGSREEAAARLGISPRTLRYKLARLRDEGYAIP